LGAAGLALAALPQRAGPAGAAGKAPVVFEWSGYEPPEFHRACIDKYGGSPEFGFFGDDTEAFEKIKTGYAPDLAHPCASTA
jgi:spermidine/putrescine-binding protein